MFVFRKKGNGILRFLRETNGQALYTKKKRILINRRLAFHSSQIKYPANIGNRYTLYGTLSCYRPTASLACIQ